MAMKETVKSLRAYFGLSGAFALLLGLKALSGGGDIGAVIAMGLGAVYIFVAVRLSYLLRDSPSTVNNILYFFSALLAVDIVLGASQQNPMLMTQGILGLLINWYLLRNVKRLSAEVHSVSPASTAH